jgi:hypothetical protein
MKGAPLTMLGSDVVLIDNESTGDPFWNDFNNKFITVIYLFSTTDRD